MGSGFLVCAPLLYSNVGNYALIAISVLLFLAYAIGAIIRFNIRYGEALFETLPAPTVFKRDEHHLHVAHRHCGHRVATTEILGLLEKFSHLILTGAYCISVSYYIQLLTNFALPAASPLPVWSGKALATLILAGIGAVGSWRGLKAIEKVEKTVVGINLGMIAALIAGLVFYNLSFLYEGSWKLKIISPPHDNIHILRLLMGMLIVVQGFETSRFLGSRHSRSERIKTMRRAQLISSAIYLLFIALMAMVIGQADIQRLAGITAIVTLSKNIAPILPLLITLTAIGSQFSAATADDAGCSGLLESILRHRVKANLNYLIVSALAIGLTWVTNVFQIISFASRAFALYYALQCLVAVMVVNNRSELTARNWRRLGYSLCALFCAAVAVFGIPAG